LLAALLCWLDARRHGRRVILRLEDLDPQRCTPALVAGLRQDLAWFGLDWDAVEVQSAHGARHHAALVALAGRGLLYPCACSRKRLRAIGRRAPDGGFAYDNACADQALSSTWADDGELIDALRLRLDEAHVVISDEAGHDLGMAVRAAFGDPVVRRRDGAVAYHLASVVDDAAHGVTHVVRGRDLATSTATQVAIQDLLGLSRPCYRHHLLLLEGDGDKLAKFHGAVGCDVLRRCYQPEELCGLLAQVAGLRSKLRPCRPQDLVADFAWSRVRTDDQVLCWNGEVLQWRP
jgi:glutamyl/glutaminyl-tRNA synthetase